MLNCEAWEFSNRTHIRAMVPYPHPVETTQQKQLHISSLACFHLVPFIPTQNYIALYLKLLLILF